MRPGWSLDTLHRLAWRPRLTCGSRRAAVLRNDTGIRDLARSLSTLSLSSTLTAAYLRGRLGQTRFDQREGLTAYFTQYGSGHLNQQRWLSTPNANKSPGHEGRRIWACIGVPDVQINHMKVAYPHIQSPTAAQQAFFLALQTGRDVFLQDGMGRGKTFALALAAAILFTRRERILVLVPTPHLARQIYDHIQALSPETPVRLMVGSDGGSRSGTGKHGSLEDATGPFIVIATPNSLSSSTSNLSRIRPSTILIDEPDTLLGPLPPRHLPPTTQAKHPFHRHPPPITSILDILVGSATVDHSRGRTQTQPRPWTVWVSATMSSLMRRTVRHRGWASGNVVDLDFSVDASTKAQRDRADILAQLPVAQEGVRKEESIVRHYALSIHPATGDMANMSTTDEAYTSPVAAHSRKSGEIHPQLIEALALIHSASPPPSGTTSLILPPEGSSLDRLTAALNELGIRASVLPPGIDRTEDDATVLITPRSAVPGLHIPNLFRVYLLSGLDMSSVPQQQYSRRLKERMTFYELVTGRMGRLGGAVPPEGSRLGSGELISLLLESEGEEQGLRAVFAGDRVSNQRLDEWDVAGTMKHLVGSSD